MNDMITTETTARQDIEVFPAEIVTIDAPATEVYKHVKGLLNQGMKLSQIYAFIEENPENISTAVRAQIEGILSELSRESSIRSYTEAIEDPKTLPISLLRAKINRAGALTLLNISSANEEVTEKCGFDFVHVAIEDLIDVMEYDVPEDASDKGAISSLIRKAKENLDLMLWTSPIYATSLGLYSLENHISTELLNYLKEEGHLVNSESLPKRNFMPARRVILNYLPAPTPPKNASATLKPPKIKGELL